MSEDKVAVIDSESETFLVVQQDTEQLRKLMMTNMGNPESLTLSDLPSIRLPLGGTTTWNVPTAKGFKSEEALVGIVLGCQNSRSYWPDKSSTGDPPQCASSDGLLGIGSPGGDCSVCPLSKFGSRGRAQACKALIRLLLLRQGSVLPYALRLPPTSHKSWRAYSLKLLSEQRPIYSVVSEIGLDSQQNPDGQKYSIATFRLDRLLEPQEVMQVKDHTELLSPIFSREALAKGD